MKNKNIMMSICYSSNIIIQYNIIYCMYSILWYNQAFPDAASIYLWT